MQKAKLVDRGGVEIADSASDDHAWQEESCWDVGSIGQNSEGVPHTEEDDHGPVGWIDGVAHNVLDDVTLSCPEVGSKGVELWPVNVVAPSLVDLVKLSRGQGALFVAGLEEVWGVEEASGGHEAPEEGFNGFHPRLGKARLSDNAVHSCVDIDEESPEASTNDSNDNGSRELLEVG